MKVLSVVGARPQFIKAAALSRVLRRRHTEVLVHTGQHYDENMSAVFFAELGLPEPDHHMGVGSDSHGRQTARMLEALEGVILRERPDCVLVYGDTNSTLAGALAAAKLGVPLAHVEAGLRSGDRRMPEEVNRILADHCADLLFCPTETSVANLAREGITRGVHLTGDIMYDALRKHLPSQEEQAEILAALGLEPGGYYLATVHRAANTDEPARLRAILSALGRLETPVLLPLHPRTRKAARGEGLSVAANVRLAEPVSYRRMLALERNAAAILTDSGGVQKEAYLLAVPCVTLRQETEWPETLACGWNVLAGTEPDAIVRAAQRPRPEGMPPPVFGDGHAAERMVEVLEV